MASLYPMARSPFWWVAYVDAKLGKRVCKSTGFRKDDPTETRKARALEAELTARELGKKTIAQGERWEAWVDPFLKSHCAKPRTLERYKLAWSWLSMYLRDKGILFPKDLTFEHAEQYVTWRTEYKKRAGKSVKVNTALNDMKVMRVIMRRAVRLEYCTVNPCDRLGIRKEETKEKPELTDADIRDIRAFLKKKDKWMQVSFEIALHTGCRQSETQIALSNVDLARKTITFASPKGGRERAFSVPMPKALEEMFIKMKKSGDKCTLQGVPQMQGKAWWEFFKEGMKRPDLCFHCTRVTFVTRHARAGTPLSVAMRLVNHSSTLVHRVYQRLGVDDVRQWQSAIAIPAA